MNRRQFLVRIGGTLIAVPVILQAVSCGDDSSGPTGTPGFDSTSESASGHTHNIRIQCTELTSGSDIVYTSSTSNSHTHTVTLAVADMATIMSGGQVTKTSSLDSSHAHGWVISKPAGVC